MHTFSYMCVNPKDIYTSEMVCSRWILIRLDERQRDIGERKMKTIYFDMHIFISKILLCVHQSTKNRKRTAEPKRIWTSKSILFVCFIRAHAHLHLFLKQRNECHRNAFQFYWYACARCTLSLVRFLRLFNDSSWSFSSIWMWKREHWQRNDHHYTQIFSVLDISHGGHRVHTVNLSQLFLILNTVAAAACSPIGFWKGSILIHNTYIQHNHIQSTFSHGDSKCWKQACVCSMALTHTKIHTQYIRSN